MAPTARCVQFVLIVITFTRYTVINGGHDVFSRGLWIFHWKIQWEDYCI